MHVGWIKKRKKRKKEKSESTQARTEDLLYAITNYTIESSATAKPGPCVELFQRRICVGD